MIGILEHDGAHIVEEWEGEQPRTYCGLEVDRSYQTHTELARVCDLCIMRASAALSRGERQRRSKWLSLFARREA